MEANLTGKWVFFPWIHNQGLNDLIHPDYLAGLEGKGIGLAFCLSDEGDYLVMRNKDLIFLGKKEGVKSIKPAPAFTWNQKVSILKKPDLNAIVNDFFWHFKDDRYYFLLQVGNKPDKRRYGADKLAAVQ